MNVSSAKKLDAMNLDPENFNWRTFDPCLKFCAVYQKLLLNAFCKPFSFENSCRGLVGRLALIVSAPLGCLVAGIVALVGIIFDLVIRVDLGYHNRKKVLEAAAYAGRKEVVKNILNLNRHCNEDLFMPLKNAGMYGHREIVEDILQRLDLNQELSLADSCGMALAIGCIESNGYTEIAELVRNKFESWKNRSKID